MEILGILGDDVYACPAALSIIYGQQAQHINVEATDVQDLSRCVRQLTDLRDPYSGQYELLMQNMLFQNTDCYCYLLSSLQEQQCFENLFVNLLLLVHQRFCDISEFLFEFLQSSSVPDEVRQNIYYCIRAPYEGTRLIDSINRCFQPYQDCVNSQTLSTQQFQTKKEFRGLYTGGFPDFRAAFLSLFVYQQTSNLENCTFIVQQIQIPLLKFAIVCELLLLDDQTDKVKKLLSILQGKVESNVETPFGDLFPIVLNGYEPKRQIIQHLQSHLLGRIVLSNYESVLDCWILYLANQ